MISYRMRPRFDERLSITSEEGFERFKQRLEDEECPYKGQFRKTHVILRIEKSKRHLWSPFIDMEFVPDEETEAASVIHVMIAPSPEVWTAFMAGYFGLIFLSFVALVLGYAQWTLEQTVWGLYLLPVLLFLIVMLYGLSLFGQKMAASQVSELHSFFHSVLGDSILKGGHSETAKS